MPTALIIGASRGIGQQLVRQYVDDGWRTIATARQATDLDGLLALGAEALPLDVTDVEACAGLGWRLDGERLDVAILNAGVYGPRHDSFPTEAEFDQVMHTNVLAAMRLLPLIAPLLLKNRGKLAVLSSLMGSLSERQANYGSLYRASKAALNSVLIDTALQFGPQGVSCIAFHPGWVRTGMGGEDADLSPEESAAGMRRTIAALAPTEKAVYLNYDGARLGW